MLVFSGHTCCRSNLSNTIKIITQNQNQTQLRQSFVHSAMQYWAKTVVAITCRHCMHKYIYLYYIKYFVFRVSSFINTVTAVLFGILLLSLSLTHEILILRHSIYLAGPYQFTVYGHMNICMYIFIYALKLNEFNYRW